ncbi:MAG: DMT family transporter [Rhodocyclaceae bacterium]
MTSPSPLRIDDVRSRRDGVSIAAVGVLVLSFDALLIRLAATSTWNVVFWRGWLLFAAIATVMLVTRHPLKLAGGWRSAAAALVIGAIYGINSTLFVFSIGHTSTANTVVIVAAAPFFAALFSWWFLGERITRRMLCSIAIAMAGVATIFGGSVGASNWRGDLAAIVLAISMGGVLTLLRHFAGLPRLPLLALSGAIAGLIALPLAEPLTLPATSYLWLGLMGLIQIPLASWLIMLAPRYIPSAEVSLFLLIETVLGPFWVWLVIHESVPPNTLIGGIIILGAVALNSWLALRAARMART